MNSLKVSADTVDLALNCFDIGCVAIGYETRARFTVEAGAFHCRRLIALEFTSGQKLAFAENRKIIAASAAAVVNAERESIRDVFFRELTESSKSGLKRISVCIDISSMTRAVMSYVCLALAAFSSEAGVEIFADFVYCPATYSKPESAEWPVSSRGPVCPELSGWAPMLNQPNALIVGLGYEPEFALGVMEFFETNYVWVFRPLNNDQRYEDALEAANTTFLSMRDPRREAFYQLEYPATIYSKLFPLISHLMESNRIVVVPFGPKPFALCSIIAGLQFMPSVAVWRVSADADNAVDRVARGNVTQFCVSFLSSADR